MKFRKTFWMNVILAIPFIIVSSFGLISNGIELFTSPLTYTTGLGLDILYLIIAAPLVPIASAYTIKTLKKVTLAQVLNVLQLTFVFLVGIYVFTEPTSMSKKIMRVELIVYIFFCLTPSIINISALATIGKK